jgi:hypothetical protein
MKVRGRQTPDHQRIESPQAVWGNRNIQLALDSVDAVSPTSIPGGTIARRAQSPRRGRTSTAILFVAVKKVKACLSRTWKSSPSIR